MNSYRVLRVILYVLGIWPYSHFVAPNRRTKLITRVLDLTEIAVKLAVITYTDLVNATTRLQLDLTTTSLIQLLALASDVIVICGLSFKTHMHFAFYTRIQSLFLDCYHCTKSERDLILERLSRRVLFDIVWKAMLTIIGMSYAMIRWQPTALEYLRQAVSFSTLLKQNALFSYSKFIALHIVAHVERFGRHHHHHRQHQMPNTSWTSLDKSYRDYFDFRAKVLNIIDNLHQLLGFVLFTCIGCGFIVCCYDLFVLFRISRRGSGDGGGTVFEVLTYSLCRSCTFLYDFVNIFIDFGSFGSALEESNSVVMRLSDQTATTITETRIGAVSYALKGFGFHRKSFLFTVRLML